MHEDWRKPFSRYSMYITHPETGEVLLARNVTESSTPIPDVKYRSLELIRRAWAKAKIAEEEIEEDLRRAEMSKLRARQMGRDSMQETADKVYARLNDWPKYVDTDRWAELLEWLDKHPPRVTPEDQQLIELDARIEQINGFPISPIILKQGRGGASRGASLSPERKAKQSLAMKKKWEEWKSNGTAPAVGRPVVNPLPKDEAPY